MRLWARIVVTWIKLGLMFAAVSACASAGNPLRQITAFDSMVPGWESKFSIERIVQPEPDGTSLLYGRIASPFRVLWMAVDSSSKGIGQRIEWVPGGIPGFAQVYFEIGHLPVAPSYKVTVWDHNFIDSRRAQAH